MLIFNQTSRIFIFFFLIWLTAQKIMVCSKTFANPNSNFHDFYSTLGIFPDYALKPVP